MTRRPRRTYTPEFKQQMVDLYELGHKTRSEISRDYDITPSALDRWIKQSRHSGSFKEADNRTPEQQEMIRLKKELQQLKMENDILKHAALIMGRK